MEELNQAISSDSIERQANDLSESIEAEKRYPFIFSGNAREYFGIWIVNMFLMLITSGFYSAWAKVRTTQYFYGNTTVDDSGFRYLADPVKILKGRAIAMVVFAIYYFSGLAGSWIELAVLLLMALLMPILVNLALAFRLRVTAWRGVRFHFNKNYLDAAWIVGGPILLSAIFPLLAIIYGLESIGLDIESSEFSLDSVGAVLTLIVLVLFLLVTPLFDYLFVKFRMNHSQFGQAKFVFSGRVWQFVRIHLTAVSVLVLAVGSVVGGFYIFTSGRIEGYEVSSEFFATYFIPLITTLPIVLAYFAYWAYLQTRRTNLIFNQTQLEDHRFESRLSFWYMLFLYISNTLAMMLTLGLLLPWAKVRTARYRAAKTTLIAAGDLQSFVDSARKEQSAIGEEVGEFFDVDLGI